MLHSEQRESPSRQPIVVRKPHFNFDASMPVLWFRDNAFLTFLFNGFNLTFPEGERMFVRAVHEHRDAITDPELLAQIDAFSAQEGHHASAHQRLFDALRGQGFNLDGFLDDYEEFSRQVREGPAARRLAATAALEHYTALLASLFFETDVLDGVDSEMRRLLVWHATEELEHRAVAFDVMQASGIGYLDRVSAFLMASTNMFYWIARGMRLFKEQSGTPTSRVWRDFRAAGKVIPGRKLLRATLSYLRPGFHPRELGSMDGAYEHMRAEGLMA